MGTDGSVTRWIGGLKAGDAAALQRLWERYWERLISLARRGFADCRRLGADEEDVLQSVFDSLFRCAQIGRFPKLNDRDDLLQILLMLTKRKAANARKREFKQSGGHARSWRDDLAEMVAEEPGPAFAAQVAEECRSLLGRLGHPDLQSIAVLKMEGRTNHEIAVRMKRSVPTVERKLRLIRSIWQDKAET
jgi:DNA-directed RNA polymerase specialized sigma24 family protein